MNIFSTLLSLLPPCHDNGKRSVCFNMLPRPVPVYESDSDETKSPEKRLRRESPKQFGSIGQRHPLSPPFSPGEVISPLRDEIKDSSEVQSAIISQAVDARDELLTPCNNTQEGDAEIKNDEDKDGAEKGDVREQSMSLRCARDVQRRCQEAVASSDIDGTASPIARRKESSRLPSVSRKPVGFKVLPLRNPVERNLISPRIDRSSQSPVPTVDLHDNPEVSVSEPDAIVQNENSAPDRPISQTEFISLSRDSFLDSDFQKPLPRLFFFFLTSCNVKELRAAAKSVSVRQDSPKINLLCAVFLGFMRQLHKGIPRLSLMLSEKVLCSFHKFSRDVKSDLDDEEVPPVKYIQNLSRARTVPENLHRAFYVVKERAKSLSKLQEPSLTTSAVASDRSNHGEVAGRGVDYNTERRTARHAVKRRAAMRVETVDISTLTPANLELETPPTSPIENDRHKNEGSVADVDKEGNKHLVLSEFGRLLIIMRDDENCRQAFLDSHQPLSRLQLDRGEKPDDFWATAIEPVFNEVGSTNYVDCSSVLPDVDTSRPPQQYRTGKLLKNWFTGFRPKFRNYLTKYKASGQNGRDFKKFIAHSSVPPGSALGQRLILAAFIFGVGGLKQDDEFLDCIERMIGPSGVGGYDAPSSQQDGEGYLNQPVIPSARKRKREELNEKSAQALSASIDVLVDTLESTVGSIKRGNSTGGNNSGNGTGNGGNILNSKDAKNDESLAVESNTLRMLSEAVERRSALPESEDFRLVKNRYTAHINRLNRLLDSMEVQSTDGNGKGDPSVV